MSQCPNCNIPLSCSCSLRSGNDGKQCCSQCVNDYNAHLQRIKQQQEQQTLQQKLSQLGNITPPHLLNMYKEHSN